MDSGIGPYSKGSSKDSAEYGQSGRIEDLIGVGEIVAYVVHHMN